ncbi:Eclosion hormone [Eumeta japonica]|uniref:Eclosion hormone n=1 Tax=Eumeta variegata TaxID=151549 RepID=A0A4C1WRM5_EUMVA|nr:Eclosion hormone [Eumeta japonica]
MAKFAFFLAAVTLLLGLQVTSGNPAIATGYDPMGICIENCAQCKKMLGPWFEGQLCADTCIKFKGKLIPDCEDLGSISPFLNKL